MDEPLIFLMETDEPLVRELPLMWNVEVEPGN